MNSDLIAKHAEVMKKANEYLKTNDINVVEYNKRLMNIYLTMLSLVCSGKLNGIDLLRFNYFYCKVDKSEKKKELNVGDLFKSTYTVDETVTNLINLVERTPKDFFEDEAPYRIIVEAALSLNSFVEILRYEFSDDIEDFVISKNERAIFEIEKEYKPVQFQSMREILGNTTINKTVEVDKTCACKSHTDEITTPAGETNSAKIKDDKVEKVKAINDLLETYDAILKYGKPFMEHERITRRRKEFLEDFKNMLITAETVAKNDVAIEVESITSGGVVRSRLNEYLYNIFRKDVVEYNYYGESLSRFIEKAVPNSNEDPRRITVYLAIPCYPVDENEYDYKKVELLYFVKRDNEWVHHESLKYGPMKGDK